MSATRAGSTVQSRSVTRTDRFQNQMVVTGDSFPGVRFLSAKSAWVIGVQRCLGCTVRSQGFSPSQRFTPTRASWLCFAPHPPIGFWSSELFPLGQPRYLSISVALLSFRQWSGAAGNRWFPITLVRHHPPYRLSARSCAEIQPCTSGLRRTSASSIIQREPSDRGWRAVRALPRVDARHSPGSRLAGNGPTAATSSKPGRRLQSLDPAESPFPEPGRYPETRPMLS